MVLCCKPSGSDQNKQNEPGSTGGVQTMASEFPAFELDELVETISQEDLSAVVNDGESKEWKRMIFDATRGEIVIKNRVATDNSVRFVGYRGGSQHSMLAVQQVNAQTSATEVWEYRYNVNGDHPEQWNQYLLPEYNLESFFDENVILPKGYQSQPAKPYINYELGPQSITVTFNKWAYMRDLESESVAPEGPLNPALIKYKYVLTWDGENFTEVQVREPGYEDVHMFPSKVIEPAEGGPGPHEFDCAHDVSVATSSVLGKQGSYSYVASNMTDRNDGTAWSEGVAGDGAGEWIEFTITSNFLIGDAWQIGNGYMRNKEAWGENGRVKKMRVMIDDKVAGYVMLANVSGYQSFSIAPSWLKDSHSFKKGTRIRFIIEEAYKGSKYDDTLISYFMPVGNCG